MPAVTLPDGRVLVVGGQGSRSATSRTCSSSIRSTDAWSAGGTAGPAAKPARRPPCSTTGSVLVTGGVTMGSPFRFSTKSTEIYHPATNTWTAGPDMATPRARHTATKLADGRVLIVGGWGGLTIATACRRPRSTTRSSNAFSSVPDTAVLPIRAVRGPACRTARCSSRAALGTPVIGGAGPNSGDDADQRRAVRSGVRTAGPSYPTCRTTTTTGRRRSLADGRVLIAGGESGPPRMGPGRRMPNCSTRLTNTWSPAAPMRVIRDRSRERCCSRDGRVLDLGRVCRPNGLAVRPTLRRAARSTTRRPTRWTARREHLGTAMGRGTTAALDDGTVCSIGGFSSVAPV